MSLPVLLASGRHPSARIPASPAASTARPSQSEASSRRAQARDSLYAQGGGGRGHSQRGAHWLGRWPRSMAARAVRVRREAWAAVLARCRLAAAASYPRLPRGSRDPFAELRERHARAGKPGLGEPSGPPEREHAPSGLLWVPPWSWWWPESWDLTQARGGVRGTGSFRGGASRGLQGRQTPSAPLWDISVQVKTLSVAEHGGL